MAMVPPASAYEVDAGRATALRRNRPPLYLRFRPSKPQKLDARAPEEIALRLKTVLLSSAFVSSVVLLSAVGAPLAAAEQQESYTFTLGLLGGLGGALDAEPDPGLNQTSWMLSAGMVSAPRTLVMVRAGRLSIEGDPAFERFAQADLEYVNIAGEYRFAQPTYDYGTYLGIGFYRMNGELLTGGETQESDIGIALGFTGDFDITRYLSFVAEISGHYVFLDDASIFGMANVGLAVHF